MRRCLPARPRTETRPRHGVAEAAVPDDGSSPAWPVDRSRLRCAVVPRHRPLLCFLAALTVSAACSAGQPPPADGARGGSAAPRDATASTRPRPVVTARRAETGGGPVASESPSNPGAAPAADARPSLSATFGPAEPRPLGATDPGPDGASDDRMRWPQPARLVAIGDLHGDARVTRQVLRLAGAIDDRDEWVGGQLVVVQTGDQIDRGDDDRLVLDRLARLESQARQAGGRMIVLNGNHEFLNALGDLRYVTPAAMRSFADVEIPAKLSAALAEIPEPARTRLAAFLPGGVYARRLATRNLAVVVGDTVFAHGGVLPRYAGQLEALNRAAREWLSGERTDLHPAIMAEDGPLWSRHYSRSSGPKVCKPLAETLVRIGAKRMVVGHTPQLSGITSACDQRVWRIDVGMAAHYGGPTQALEITSAGVRILGGESRPGQRDGNGRGGPRSAATPG
ncbi:MAG: calcineurin [Myxococcales bacterium FL481]|nr:MAG: calcineurin [Myxococcales bacterium FL481]